MNGLRAAGYLVLILGVVIVVGLLGPFNPSCGTGIYGFFSQLFGACQAYNPYVGLGVIIAGIILVAVSGKDDE